MYYNNHTHSEYSNAQLGFADCTNKIHDLIDTAYAIGLLGVTLTDHEGIMGHIEVLKYYNQKKKYWDRPFKLGLGNEIYLMTQQEYEYNQTLPNDPIPYYHMVLTALDTTGHYQLRQISDCAWKRAKTIKGFMRKPTYYHDIEEAIGQDRGHIIASTACAGSYLGYHILKWKKTGDGFYKQLIHQFISWGINTFGHSNFYLELQPCDGIHNIDQNIINEVMVVLANAYHLKLIPTTDAHYLRYEDRFVHETLLKSKDGDREVSEFYSTTYLMSAQELRSFLSSGNGTYQFTNEQIDAMFANTKEIYERIQEYHLDHAPIIPEIPAQYIEPFEIQHCFKDYYAQYPSFKWYATEATYIHDQYFFYRIEKALINKVVNRGLDIETYIKRCDTEMHELRIISGYFESSMASYSNVVSNIVQLIWDSGSIVGCGRGSSDCFVINYLLDITQNDPIPFGDYLPHWRFVSGQRKDSLPDIDVDSQASKREIILENLKKYFGYDKVLNVSTVSQLTAKVAIERSVKGLGLNDDISGYLKSLVPVERGATWTIQECLYGDSEKKHAPIKEFIDEVDKYEHLRECIEKLEGLIYNRGIHAAGVVITNKPYVNYIGGMRSPTGVACTSYNLHDVEYCGVVKFDLLTVQALDKIAATMDLLETFNQIQNQGSLQKTYNKYLHPAVIQYTDPILWKDIDEVYSVFQYDTIVGINALKEVSPHNLMELSAANSLMRLQVSGEEQPLQQYRRYKQDIHEWEKDCDSFGLTEHEKDILCKYLSDSYMLADSQEKVMQLSMDPEVAGFTLTEAHALRKGIAKFLAY